ncbi:hypothetical protein DFJ73DRAFT_628862 [Zopfochytrium polystomum]|nr:hypothetical protein DFJ73DRAFT_628862 [Zopfochytrium polystomum]
MASTPAQPTSSSSLWNINPAKPETWPTVKETMLPDAFHEVEHAKSSTKTWFWVNIFFTAPALGAVSWYVLPDEFNHIAHVHEHVKDYVAWPHLGKRKDVSRPFAWLSLLFGCFFFLVLFFAHTLAFLAPPPPFP